MKREKRKIEDPLFDPSIELPFQLISDIKPLTPLKRSDLITTTRPTSGE